MKVNVVRTLTHNQNFHDSPIKDNIHHQSLQSESRPRQKMKTLILLACLVATVCGQVAQQKITFAAAKDWSNGSLNLTVQGITINIPASVLQLASNMLNLLNISMQRALAYDTAIYIDVPISDQPDAFVFKIWGNDWRLSKTTSDIPNFARTVEFVRTMILAFQQAWTSFVV